MVNIVIRGLIVTVAATVSITAGNVYTSQAQTTLIPQPIRVVVPQKVGFMSENALNLSIELEDERDVNPDTESSGSLLENAARIDYSLQVN